LHARKNVQQTDGVAHLGVIVQGCADGGLQVLEKGVLCVDSAGRVVEVGEDPALLERAASVVDWHGSMILPGLVDAHLHLPQAPFCGIGGGELLAWLKQQAFPTEARFADTGLASAVAQRFFSQLASAGTTSAAVFMSVHPAATHAAFMAAAQSGLRVWMGNALMDRACPSELRLAPREAVAASEALIRDWHGKGRLRYLVTPRFALSCSPGLLQAAGDLARKYDLRVQTHLSENRSEIKAVASAFPACANYGSVYARFGCLQQALLAHCLHLETEELELLAQGHASVVHCPSSNRFLGSGVLGYQRILDAGITLAMGTDVGAGYGVSMLKEMREAMESSKTWNLLHPEQPQEIMSLGRALYMATAGGAEALGAGDDIGTLAAGYQADFVVLDDSCVNPWSQDQLFQHPEQRLQRMVYHGEAALVRATYVGGECVFLRPDEAATSSD